MAKARGQHVEVDEVTEEPIEVPSAEDAPDVTVVIEEPEPEKAEKSIVTLYGNPTKPDVFNGVEKYTANLGEGSIRFTDELGKEYVHSGHFTIQKVRNK